jgi:hypothetical protein
MLGYQMDMGVIYEGIKGAAVRYTRVSRRHQFDMLGYQRKIAGKGAVKGAEAGKCTGNGAGRAPGKSACRCTDSGTVSGAGSGEGSGARSGAGSGAGCDIRGYQRSSSSIHKGIKEASV